MQVVVQPTECVVCLAITIICLFVVVHIVIISLHNQLMAVLIFNLMLVREIYYVFEKPIYKKGDFQNPDDEFSLSNIEKIETNTIKLKLIGANPNAIIEASDKTQYLENFYLSYCPDGILNVNTYPVKRQG